jgi:acyl dehydratase
MAEQAAGEDQRVEMRAENLHQGMRLGPIFYIVESQQISAFAAALHTANPLYQGDSPVAPPTMRLNDYALLIAQHFKGGKGGVHARHRCEFFVPVHAGQAVRVDGTVTATERKRGKFYFTLEYETRDATDNRLLMRQAITSVLINPEGELA